MAFERVYISVDMEGVSGIVDWEQCVAGGDDYALGRELLIGEVNAAIDGALAAGAKQFLVNDAHSAMRNIPPGALGGRASYISGRFKPRYMMEGLDESFDAVLFIGYHAAMPTPGILSHTYNPRAIADVSINGTMTGEAGLNALVAQHFGVPVAVVTGDQHVLAEAAPFCPGIRGAQVKTSISRYAAGNLHPDEARELIRATVAAALGPDSEARLPSIRMPTEIEVRFVSPDMAEQATWIRGVNRAGRDTVRFSDSEPLALFQTFMALVYLTRSLAESR
jgi:D-amino peptidase